jgi:hypothetical protein
MRARVGLLAAVVACAACAVTPPGGVQRVPGADRLGSVAVLPFRTSSTGARAPVPAAVGVEAAGGLADRLAVAGVPVVDGARVRAATPATPADAWTPALAARVGRTVGADLAVLGVLTRYEEREGTAWGATVPATVWFDAVLVRTADASVVDHRRFEVTQQPLSENVLSLPRFLSGGGRWMTREELLGRGLDETAHAFARAIAKAP